jgi:ferrous iron transport protein A
MHVTVNNYQNQKGVISIMTLKQGKNNGRYQVISIDTELKLERRLEALGLTEGTLVTVLNNDKKGSLTAKFRGTRFALGKCIADHIEVREAGA